MLTIIFVVVLIWVAWKMPVLGVKAAWGIAKTICTVVLLPMFLFALVCVGLIYVAILILVFVGLILLIGRITTN